ncbi:hypothetical protein [Kineococcus sp. SYSU DK003]|uniref:hypothetical protein n=1 Tax=Kineococcus sp. SYSU DK003 TaxID=3383124 RepID=UPI003D7C92B9
MEPLHLARGLAVLNTVVDGSLIAVGQAVFDEPSRGRRWVKWCAVGAVGGLVLAASDAVWNAATREHAPAPDAGVSWPVHETTVTLRQFTVAAAATPVWLLGRGLPERLRRRGVDRPNRLLGVPLGIAYAAATGPGWFRHAHDRVAALDH